MKTLFKCCHAFLLCTTLTVFASPAEDLGQFRAYFKDKFPSVPFNEFNNGVYAINEDARIAWQDIEEFPPYEEAILNGKALFETSFTNGRNYGNCFENNGVGVSQNYPYWDRARQQVITLALALNLCREESGIPALKYTEAKLTSILAYMVYTSREMKTNARIPTNDKKALESYKKGKKFYYQRRGQLNFSCATCHIQNSGRRIRSETLSPSLGHTTGWPVYRAKWGSVGTLHRRFIGCSKQMRAKEYKLQSEEYRNLEYFLTYMSNGLPINGPSYRK